MSSPHDTKSYKVWALDDAVYGPVEMDSLVNWARDERILPESWVFCETTRKWLQALELTELRPIFGLEVPSFGSDSLIRPGMLRRVRVLSDLTDEQLVRFGQAGEIVRFPPYTPVMKAGSVGDSVFFIIEGQVRLRIQLKGKEILIGVQEAGGVFGQISLFDSGPRVTDAYTDSEVEVLKVSGANFRRICRQYPEIAVPVLLNLGRTLASRIRTDDKHLAEMVAMSGNSH